MSNIIFTDDQIADIECADLSVEYVTSLLTTHFPTAKDIKIILIEYNEVMVNVDGCVHIADNDGNVYKYAEED